MNMTNFLSFVLTGLELLGLLAVVVLDLAACFGMAFMNFVFAFDAPNSEEKLPSVLGLILLLVLASLSIQGAAIWYGLHLGKLWLALVLGVLTIPAYPFVMFLAAVVEVACGWRRTWLQRLVRPSRPAAQASSLAKQGNPDKVIPQTNQPSMNPDLPPTNPTACDALVSEAEQLPPGSMANEKLIEDCLMTAFITASAKHQSQIPLETMVEPHISRQPAGSRGRMAWEEILVFQTTPKTAVRVAFEEDGKGGAGFAIGQN